jgi:hypothetical protein
MPFDAPRYDYAPQWRSQLACERDLHAWAIADARAVRRPAAKAAALRRAAVHRANAQHYAAKIRRIGA